MHSFVRDEELFSGGGDNAGNRVLDIVGPPERTQDFDFNTPPPANRQGIYFKRDGSAIGVV